MIAGVGITSFAYTKFIWSETLCIFLPLFVICLFIKTTMVKNPFLRHLLSIFTAFVLAVSPAAHPRLWLLVAAFILTVIIAKYILHVKSFYTVSFLPALGVFLAFQVYISLIRSPLNLLGFGGAGNTLHALIGQLFYFATSTWGFGMLGVCLCFSVFFIKNKKALPKEQALMFSFVYFTFFYNMFMLIISAVQGGVMLAGEQARQDMFIFGRYIDGGVPFVLILTLCYLFIYGLDFRKLLQAIIVLGVVFAAFLNFTAPLMVKASAPSTESIQGFSPLRIGFEIDSVFDCIRDVLFYCAVSCFCELCGKIPRIYDFALCGNRRIIYLHTHGVRLSAARKSAGGICQRKNLCNIGICL
jgi:hypothetical protein